MTIIWCIVPEIWSMTDRIFVILDCFFLPFYLPNNLKNQNFEKLKKIPGDIIILHMWTKNDNQRKYGSWDIEHDRQFFVILDHFLPFYSPNNPKNQNFEKIKKNPGDITILHKCTKNQDHMPYCSWDMARDRCNYFSFWTIFCLFTPLTARKMKIKKKRKKLLEILSFYTRVPKIMIIWYTVPEIWPVTDVIIFHFGLFFALLPP